MPPLCKGWCISMEIWKDIPGYEGKYQASTEGRIRSIDRLVCAKCHYTGKDFYRRMTGRVLKPGQYCGNGHVSVVLGHGTAGRPVHQLIMITFAGPLPTGWKFFISTVIQKTIGSQICDTEHGQRISSTSIGKAAFGESFLRRTLVQSDSDYRAG